MGSTKFPWQHGHFWFAGLLVVLLGNLRCAGEELYGCGSSHHDMAWPSLVVFLVILEGCLWAARKAQKFMPTVTCRSPWLRSFAARCCLTWPAICHTTTINFTWRPNALTTSLAAVLAAWLAHAALQNGNALLTRRRNLKPPPTFQALALPFCVFCSLSCSHCFRISKSF